MIGFFNYLLPFSVCTSQCYFLIIIYAILCVIKSTSEQKNIFVIKRFRNYLRRVMGKYKQNLINVSDHVAVTDIINCIVKTNPENPFFVCDLDDIIEKHQLWKKIIPEIQPYYAVRCNDSEVVLRTLAALGMGFSCVSKSEIKKVLSIGVDRSQIIFNNTTKFCNHIEYAMEKGVKLMTFDSEEELRQIHRLHPDAKLIIHIHIFKSHPPLETKSGCDPYTEASILLKIAVSLNMAVIGTAFNIDLNLNRYEIDNNIKSVFHIFGIADKFGFKFDTLCIGGDHPSMPDEHIYSISKHINSFIHRNVWNRDLKIIMESGSYFTRSASKLACSVFGVNEKQQRDPITKGNFTQYNYYIEDGAHGNLNGIFYWKIKLYPELLSKQNEAKYPSVLWGPTCDSADIVHNNLLLPKLECGDWIIFNNMGCYTTVVTSNFNGFGSSSTFYLISKLNWLKHHKELAFQGNLINFIE